MSITEHIRVIVNCDLKTSYAIADAVVSTISLPDTPNKQSVIDCLCLAAERVSYRNNPVAYCVLMHNLFDHATYELFKDITKKIVVFENGVFKIT